MKKKIFKMLSFLISFVVLLECGSTASFAASGKAYIFTFDTYDLNSREAGGQESLGYLWNMGYDAGEYLNNSAADAYSVMANADFWYKFVYGTENYDRMANRFLKGNTTQSLYQ